MEFLKKRIINIRVMFVCFAGMMAGILFSFSFLLSKISIGWSIALSIIMAILIVACYYYAIATEKHNSKYGARVKVSKLIKVASISFLVAFVVGMSLVVFPLFKIMTMKHYSGEVAVTGVVCDYVEDKSTYKKFVIDNCTIDGVVGSETIGYKVIVYTSTMMQISLGDKLSFVGELDKFEVANSAGFAKLVQGIGYSSYVNIGDIVSINGKAELRDVIKSEARDVLYDNLSYDNANIAYGILFGEKQGLNQDITEAFSYAGISHILAVSGLHIGVLFVLIYKALKKCKMNGWARLAILGVVLVFYAYLCNFTPSVSRASIMCILVALCDILKIEYDGISSLSIAGIIILLFDPLALFTTSFQLSFLCIFSIIAFAPFLTMMLKKIKMPEFIASALAVSVATNIVILPVCLNTFDKVSMLGVFTNILVLPIFSVTYILLFVVMFMSLIFNSLGVLLVVPDLFLHLIKLIANFSSVLPFGIFKAFNISYLAVLAILLACLVIHFVMIKKMHKFIVSMVMLVVIVGLFISGLIPKNYVGNNIILNYDYKNQSIIYVEDNNVTLIGCKLDMYTLSKKMKAAKISKIDNIIAYDFELNNLKELQDIIESYSVDSIYLNECYNYSQIEEKLCRVVYYNNSLSLGDLSLKFFDEDGYGFYFEVGEIGTFLNILDNKIIENNELDVIYKNIDYLIIQDMIDENTIDNFNAGKIICNDYTNSIRDNLINLKTCDRMVVSGV